MRRSAHARAFAPIDDGDDHLDVAPSGEHHTPVLPMERKPRSLRSELADIAYVAQEGATAASYGLDAEADPSPVGYHELENYIMMAVDGHFCPSMIRVEMRRSLGSGVVDTPFVYVDVHGVGFDTGGIASAQDHQLSFAVSNRAMLRSMADAMRYLADKAEARGMLEGFPEDHAHTARMQIDDERRAALEHVRSILNGEGEWGQQFGQVGCSCTTCFILRETNFECKHCGYAGPPKVYACECQAAYAKDIAREERLLAILTAQGGGTYSEHGITYTLDGVAATHEHTLRSRPPGHGPNGTCFAGPDGEPDRYDNCLHGNIDCPFCGEATLDASRLLEIVRELRATLVSVVPGLTAAATAAVSAEDPVVESDANHGTAPDPAVSHSSTSGDVGKEETPASVVLLDSLPTRRASLPPDDLARVAVERQAAWLNSLFDEQGRAKAFARINAIYDEALHRTMRGEPAWSGAHSDYRLAHGDDGRRTVEQLRKEYLDSLAEASVIDTPGWEGVFDEAGPSTDKRYMAVRPEPGLYADYFLGGLSAVFDLSLGTLKSDDGEPLVDIRVLVGSDVTLQCEVAEWLETLRDRYMPEGERDGG